LEELKLKKGRLDASFLYSKGSFFVKGELLGTLGEDVKVEKLFLDASHFLLSAEGFLKEGKKGSLRFRGSLKPLKAGRFSLEGARFRGRADLSLPRLTLTAWLQTESLSVGERTYAPLSGELRGEGRLLESFRLRGELLSEELSASFDYRLLPENFLSFRFEGVPVDEKTLSLKEKVSLHLSGEGTLDLKGGLLRLKARAPNALLSLYTFRHLEADLSYDLKKKEGFAEALLREPGEGRLKVKFGKVLEGEGTLRDLPLAYGGFKGLLKGNLSFKKEKELRAETDLTVKEPSVKEVALPDLRLYGSLRGEKLDFNLSGRGVEGKLFGTTKRPQGELKLKNFKAKHPAFELLVRKGRLSFAKEEELKVKGDLRDFQVEGKGFKVWGESGLEVKGKEVKAKGVLNADAGGKPLERNFSYRLNLKEEELSFKGESEKTRLSARYHLKKKEGVFKGLRKDRLSLRFKGKVKEGILKADFEGSFKTGADELTLKGNLTAEEGRLKLSLLPQTYRGRRFSYRFGGLELFKEGERLRGTFKGLKVSFLRRPFLEFSSATLKGEGDKLYLEGLSVKGVLEGKVDFKKEEEPLLKAQGKLNLTELSKHMASLMKHDLRGEVFVSFRLKGKEFLLSVDTKEPIKALSEFFYEPFTGAVGGEVRPDRLLFSLSFWFKKGYGIAYVMSEDFKNFTLKYDLSGVPFRLADGVRARLLTQTKGSLTVENFKRFFLKGSAVADGFVKIEKKPGGGKGEEKKELPVEVFVDYAFKTSKGIELRLPEGRVLSSLEGKVKGKLPDLNYRVKVYLRSGKLSYFGRTFYLRSSTVEAVKEGDREETKLDLTLNTDLDGYKVFLKVFGDAKEPQVFYFSEPPLSKEEILMALIGGGTEESLLPVAEVLSQEFKAVGAFKGFFERLFDVRITLGFTTSPTGEVGTVARLKKAIGKYLSLVYQTSSLKERRSNYFGGEVKPPLDLEVAFQFYFYSDQTREYKFRYTKEFDF